LPSGITAKTAPPPLNKKASGKAYDFDMVKKARLDQDENSDEDDIIIFVGAIVGR